MFFENVIQRIKYRDWLKSMQNVTVLNDGDYELITDTETILKNIENRLNPPKEQDNIIILPCINDKQSDNVELQGEFESESCLDEPTN